MKITITLSDSEVKGIKSYLKSVSPDVSPRIKKSDIEQEIREIVNGNIYSGAMGDYVIHEAMKEKK